MWPIRGMFLGLWLWLWCVCVSVTVRGVHSLVELDDSSFDSTITAQRQRQRQGEGQEGQEGEESEGDLWIIDFYAVS
jgi:hypothetical protein